MNKDTTWKSVRKPVSESVRSSIGDLTENSARYSVRDSVWALVWRPVREVRYLVEGAFDE